MPFYKVYEDGVVESVKNYFTEMFSVYNNTFKISIIISFV